MKSRRRKKRKHQAPTRQRTIIPRSLRNVFRPKSKYRGRIIELKENHKNVLNDIDNNNFKKLTYYCKGNDANNDKPNTDEEEEDNLTKCSELLEVINYRDPDMSASGSAKEKWLARLSKLSELGSNIFGGEEASKAVGFAVPGLSEMKIMADMSTETLDYYQIVKLKLDEILTNHITICRLLFASMPAVHPEEAINPYILNKIRRYILRTEKVLPVLLILTTNYIVQELELTSYYFARLLNMLLQLTNVENKNNKIYQLLAKNMYLFVCVFYRGMVGVSRNEFEDGSKKGGIDSFNTLNMTAVHRISKKFWQNVETKQKVHKYILAIVRITLNKYDLKGEPRLLKGESEKQVEKLKEFESILKQEPFSEDNFSKIEKIVISSDKSYYSKHKGLSKVLNFSRLPSEDENQYARWLYYNIENSLQQLGKDLYILETPKYLNKLSGVVDFVRRKQNRIKSPTGNASSQIQHVTRLANSVTFRFADLGSYMTVFDVFPDWRMRNLKNKPTYNTLQQRKGGGQWLNTSGIQDLGGFVTDEEPPAYTFIQPSAPPKIIHSEKKLETDNMKNILNEMFNCNNNDRSCKCIAVTENGSLCNNNSLIAFHTDDKDNTSYTKLHFCSKHLCSRDAMKAPPLTRFENTTDKIKMYRTYKDLAKKFNEGNIPEYHKHLLEKYNGWKSQEKQDYEYAVGTGQIELVEEKPWMDVYNFYQHLRQEEFGKYANRDKYRNALEPNKRICPPVRIRQTVL